jgi:hypothetical protein
MTESLALGFDPVEDRLALTITSGDAEKRTIHLTRRVTRRLADILTRLARETAEAPANVDDAQRGNLAALHHDAVAGRTPIQSGRMKRPSSDPADRPLLVTGLRSGRFRSGSPRWLIEFSCEGDQKIKITMSKRMLHAFIELLRRRLPTTEWGIELLAAPTDERHRLVMH